MPTQEVLVIEDFFVGDDGVSFVGEGGLGKGCAKAVFGSTTKLARPRPLALGIT